MSGTKIPDPLKWRLVEGLYQHGARDLAALNTALPEWGPDKLKHHVKCFKMATKRRADKAQQKVGAEAFMKQWLTHTHNIHTLQTKHKPPKRGRRGRKVCQDHTYLLSKASKAGKSGVG
ncbi:hypothetical protein GWK47_026106 [Chionoecetes opilio]|uniref:Uncharacterized protein n=1 Tax=Chionoecetes opilio TaxID=41210 RepID=A0A8J8WMY4_CHIOP|nr:hypothetical protein GWK47_026106 [Chionoecetes opilio]